MQNAECTISCKRPGAGTPPAPTAAAASRLPAAHGGKRPLTRLACGLLPTAYRRPVLAFPPVTLPGPLGLTDETCRKARRHLMRVDPVIAALARRHGACPLGARTAEPALRALVRALVSQQLSVKAAETIFRRFLALFPGDGFPGPADILAVHADRLREVGMSRPKGRYLRDLCERVRAGLLPLDRLDAMPDDEVVRVLTEVKGIGQWTAEMILIFQLGRPDVLPLDDVGLLRGIQRAYGLRSRPKPAKVEKLAAPWRPYRSVACWYLWASLEK